MDCSPPGSSVLGVSQVRILEWVAMTSSRGASRPRDWTCISYIGRCIFDHGVTREAPPPHACVCVCVCYTHIHIHILSVLFLWTILINSILRLIGPWTVETNLSGEHRSWNSLLPVDHIQGDRLRAVTCDIHEGPHRRASSQSKDSGVHMRTSHWLAVPGQGARPHSALIALSVVQRWRDFLQGPQDVHPRCWA